MADIASLVLAIDSTSAKRAATDLDGLAASGARAEAATVGLSGGFKGAGAEASAMAAAAQLSARAAMDQAAGFGTATNAARVNTMAMRESLVVARELSRGNFTRIPGSLTLLAQGISSGGGLGAFAQAIGLIKQVQNAELAEAATAAATAAAGVEAAARKAGANILAADTEVALAEAQLRVAESATASAAAQARLAAANEAVAAAAAEAAIAEDALAVAQGRSAEAAAASQAKTVTRLGRLGAVLGPLTIGAIGVEGAFKALQATVDDSGALDRYAQSLVKTKDQLKDLEDKVGGFQITWGDVFHGVSKAVSDALDTSDAWEAFKEQNRSGFALLLHNAIDTMGGLYGAVRGTYQTIVDDWSKLPAAFGDAFYSAVNVAIGALNKLVKFGTDQLNTLLASVSKMTGFNLGSVSASQIAPVGNPYSGTAKSVSNDASANIAKYTAQGRSALQSAADTVYDDIVDAAKKRIKDGLPKAKKGRTKKPKKAPVDPSFDISARLDEQILAAKEQLAGTAEMQLHYELQRIEIERDKTATDAAQKLAEGKITAGEEQHIEQQAAQLADLKAQAAIRKEQTTLLTQQQAAQDQLFGFQTDALKAADDAAKSQADHRTIQLQMLDIAYQQKAFDLQILESKQKLAGDLAAAALTQGQINHLPTQKAFDQAQTLRNTQDPLQAWLDKIPNDAKTITEAFQGIEVNGLDSLASSIAGVVTGTESLGKAFKNISTQIIGDIIQMTVKMLLFRAISSVFGSIGGGGGFGGVTSLPTSFSGIPHWASGGSMIIGGNGGVDNNVLSLNGNALANVGQGETLSVTPNRPAANNNGRQQIELTIVTAPSDEAWAKVSNISAQQIGSAAPIIIKQAATSTIKAITRPKISGGR